MTDSYSAVINRLALAEKSLLEADAQMARAGFLESPWVNYRGSLSEEMYYIDNYLDTEEER